jgi:hypothetical protein
LPEISDTIKPAPKTFYEKEEEDVEIPWEKPKPKSADEEPF